MSPKSNHLFRCIVVAALGALVLLPGELWAAAELSLTDRLAQTLETSLQDGSLWVALLMSCLGGFLTSQTPCVYPLIPITVRYFGGIEGASRPRVVGLATIYVGGMILLYAVLGTVFAASNLVFGSFLASPWVVAAIAVFCAAMGLSMLGAFTLQLPPALSTRLSQVGGQGAGGAFAMGLVSGLVAAPCTGPVLLVILTVIAAQGAILHGFFLMVAFGLGLGLPFLLLAIFSNSLQRLPKGGPWMNLVKGFLAVGMFVVALYFAQLAWPSLGIFFANVPASAGVAWVFVAAGVALLLLVLRGAAFRGSQGVAVACLTVGISVGVWGGPQLHELDADGAPALVWLTSHDEGLALALAQKRPVMIDFTADWCAACKELDRHTYTDVEVRQELARFVSLKLDATEMDDAMQALFEKYKVLGLPTVLFIDSEGNVLDEPKITGFMEANRFLPLLKQIP